MAELDLLERQGTLISRAITHKLLGDLAGLICGLGQQFQRTMGPITGDEALAMLLETLDDCNSHTEKFFNEQTEDSEHDPNATDGPT